MIIKKWFKYEQYINKNGKFEHFSNIIIKRNYGIDLLRIFSMINIINLHINLYSRQLYLNASNPKFKHIWRLEVFSYHAVNCFGLISGIVGYKKYKFSNLIYLWIKTFFYSIFISSYLFSLKKIKIKNLILSSFPILITRNWYINAYFCMYLLLPFINFGIISLKRKLHRNIIIFFIMFYCFYNIIAKLLLSNLNTFLYGGYSSMWLILLYIIGSYFGKYIIMFKNVSFIYFLIYSIIFLLSTFLSSEIYFKLNEIKLKIPKTILISYISPTMIMQAISMIMIFTKIKINKPLIKIISFLSPLTFSALPIHEHLFQSKTNIIIILFNWIIMFKKKFLFFKIYGVGTLIYFACVFIDYIRFLIFKILKIKQFCLFLEKKFPELLDKIISLLN